MTPKSSFKILALFSPDNPGIAFLIEFIFESTTNPFLFSISSLFSYIPWPSDANLFVFGSINVNVPIPIILSLIYSPNDFSLFLVSTIFILVLIICWSLLRINLV